MSFDSVPKILADILAEQRAMREVLERIAQGVPTSKPEAAQPAAKAEAKSAAKAEPAAKPEAKADTVSDEEFVSRLKVVLRSNTELVAATLAEYGVPRATQVPAERRAEFLAAVGA